MECDDIAILDNSDVEPCEALGLSLISAFSAAAPSTATLIIYDDEGMYSILHACIMYYMHV